jgi:hypothetical protein
VQSQSTGGGAANAQEEEAGDPRIGVAKGEFEAPDSFFEPLPDELLKAFRGE